MGMIRVIQAGWTCFEIITQDKHPYHTSWPDLKNNDLVWELRWAWSVSYGLARHALRLLHRTYIRTIWAGQTWRIMTYCESSDGHDPCHMGWLDKPSNGCSSRVMVPRVEACVFQQIRVFTRILWMRQWSGGPNGGGICTPMDMGTYNYFIKYNANTVFYSLHTLCGDKLGIKSLPSHQMDAAAERQSQQQWHINSKGPGYLP